MRVLRFQQSSFFLMIGLVFVSSVAQAHTPWQTASESLRQCDPQLFHAETIALQYAAKHFQYVTADSQPILTQPPFFKQGAHHAS